MVVVVVVNSGAALVAGVIIATFVAGMVKF